MTDIHFLDPNPAGGQPVLLLHGLGVNGLSWLAQFDALATAGLRPLAVDVPGFGKSPYDGRGWRMAGVAARLADFLQDLGAAPAHVVGLSMGGVIAQQFALDFPHLTRRLALVNTFAALRPRSMGGWIYFWRRAILVHFIGMNTQASFVARRVFPRPDQQELRAAFIDQVMQADPRAYRAAMRALGFCNLTPRLGKLRIPTLVITGANDTTVPPASQRDLLKSIPGAQQVIIPDAGHGVSVEQPEVFNRVLVNFLTDANLPENP